MAIKGVIVAVGQVFNGTKKDGSPFSSQECVLETVGGKYQDKIAFKLMNDNIGKAALQPGHMVEIEVNISSREHQGRWYTEIRAWKVTNFGFVQQQPQPQYAPQQQYASQPVYQQTPPPGYQPTVQPQPQQFTPQPNPAPQPFGGSAFPPAPVPPSNDDLAF